MTLINKACYERGCACYDDRVDGDAVEVVLAQTQEPDDIASILACRDMLDAQPVPPRTEQEPVAWMWDVNNGAGYSSQGIGFYQTDIPFAKHTPLYTTPPQRTWVNLTVDELIDLEHKHLRHGDLARAIEAKLKELNT